jgi:CHAT domain-containing protein
MSRDASHQAFILPLVVAGVLCAGVLWWLLSWTNRQPRAAETLLAEAYAEHRSMDLRIQGAAYEARVLTSRGDVSLHQPRPLLKAEILISQQLKQHPNDPSWLHASAVADLLNNQYGSAIETLGHARAFDPKASDILRDLATGYYQRAESLDRQIDYETAIDYLGQALSYSPKDPIALFNRAVVFERILMPRQALKDWECYLQLDRDGPWAAEARSHYQSLVAKLQDHDRVLMTPLLGPNEFVATVDPADESTWSKVDDRVESYLGLAIEEWLPRAFVAASPASARIEQGKARQALSLLSRILAKRHDDLWLDDLLHAQERSPQSQGLQYLAKALQANNRGDSEIGGGFAVQSAHSFERTGNQAGLARAQVEEIYSLHRTFHGPQCLRRASELRPMLAGKKYTWIETQLNLEQFSCLESQANMGEGPFYIAHALSLSDTAHYSLLHLRALGFAAVTQTNKNNLTQAEAWDFAGLQKYWSGTYPYLRAYQFYDDRDEHARQLGQWYLANALASEAASAIDFSDNRPGKAMSRFRVAISANLIGRRQQATQQYREAKEIFSSLPPTTEHQGFEADLEFQYAEALAANGQFNEAEATLRAAKSKLPADFDAYETWLTYYRTRANLLQERKDYEQLEPACNAVIALGELGLRTIASDRDRLNWNHATAACYKAMAALRLNKNDADGALELWEWYLSASLRSKRKAPAAISFAEMENSATIPEIKDVRNNLYKLDHATILSYALLPQRVIAWVYDNRGIRWRELSADPGEVVHLSHEFAAQCSDPHSDINALRANGRRLYDQLMAPFESYLDPNRTLMIEADSDLAVIPFQALLKPSGSYVGLDSIVVSSPGFGFSLLLRRDHLISSKLKALVVAAPATQNVSYPPLPDATQEGRDVSSYFGTSVLLTGYAATSRAVLFNLGHSGVFHFAGHAISSPEGIGLVLAGGEPESGLADTLLTPEAVSTAPVGTLRLVVLSACSTGLAGVDGMGDTQNIAAAFLRARVPHVVASRWNVDSSATARFMAVFYQQLLLGSDVPEALRKASAQMAGRSATMHPYYWAAFTAFGRA